MYFFIEYIYIKESNQKGTTMKNTLAENMRRFGTKNLGPINEQGVIPPSIAAQSTPDASASEPDPELEQLENEVLDADMNDPNPMIKLGQYLIQSRRDMGKWFDGLIKRQINMPNGAKKAETLCNYYETHEPALQRAGIKTFASNILNKIRTKYRLLRGKSSAGNTSNRSLTSEY
jgi:hypothetical protein